MRPAVFATLKASHILQPVMAWNNKSPVCCHNLYFSGIQPADAENRAGECHASHEDCRGKAA